MKYGAFIELLMNWCWFTTITLRVVRSRDCALARIGQFLRDLETESGSGIGWLFAENLGRIGGRWHVHILVAGVDALSIDAWQREANRRFGLTRIEPFELGRGGGHYVAKNALAPGGDLHIGGKLLEHAQDQQQARKQGIIIAPSANVPSWLFHMTLRRRRGR